MICHTLICAQNIIVDHQSDRVSLINIVERISSPNFPIVAPLMVYVILKQESQEQANEPLVFLKIDIGETELAKSAFDVVFTDGFSKTVLNIEGLIIPNAGALTFSVWDNEKQLKSYEAIVQDSGSTKVKPTLIPGS